MATCVRKRLLTAVLLLVAALTLPCPGAEARRHHRNAPTQAPPAVQEPIDQQASESTADNVVLQDESSTPAVPESTSAPEAAATTAAPAQPAPSFADAAGGFLKTEVLVVCLLILVIGGNCAICAAVWHTIKARQGGRNPQTG